jgi:hypothetical protein
LSNLLTYGLAMSTVLFVAVVNLVEALPCNPTDRETVPLIENVYATQTKTEHDEAWARLMHFQSELSRRRQ